MHTQTQSQTQGYETVATQPRAAARTPRKKVSAKEKFAVIVAVADALKARNFPPMDERLKSIVASQVGVLLAGGWPFEEVRHEAVALGLSWDELRGHNRLTHLLSRMRMADADRSRLAHEERMRVERAELAGKGRDTVWRDPSLHDFARSDEPNTCAVCRGPLGVHVRRKVDA